ncbi:hypothetical protein GOP47_0010917 [Adiantum capillus-veneris]|uniref:Uncharacterized protein n=1 Tax=Adiantum capillus-veneris TaxID=13818 RepID=A0A9D4UW13_ADICA|nr:hypothetical protein GOP47_0010917 [Adiantum capillus-veneris]
MSMHATVTTISKASSSSLLILLYLTLLMLVFYQRCIYLMYVKRNDMVACGRFFGVDVVLCMLRLATEFVFQDHMDTCMEYLSMLCSWTLAEEASIRLALSSLQVCDIHRDLARRLSLLQGVPWDEPTIAARRMLVNLLQSCEPAMKGLDESKPIPKASICMVWNAHWDVIKRTKSLKISKYWSRKEEQANATLLMLFDRLLELGTADAVVRLFAWDEGASCPLIGLFNDNLLCLKLLFKV